ncbi:MAG: rod shape-determining protein MreC [Muribaculaceae bacterium]|nr:rod shape-determining protein MreC [Muribaculaceae bacterium]
MRNLLNFFIRFGAWFVFFFYVILACVILFSYNSYHSSIYFSSANIVSSSVYGVFSDFTGYFNLRKINQSLQENNARLENEVLNLRHQLAEYRTLTSDTTEFAGIPRYDYVAATVINNNVRHPKNYFSINRGSEDGIRKGQGVVDQNGVVGIVNVTGKNTARVISLLNESQRFSVKLKDGNYIGSLVWKGGDPSIAYMEEVPRHVKYQAGDTVVTSGYSLSFPANIPVGTIMNRIKGTDDNFFILKIRLNPDFKNLGTVRVIKDNFKESIDSLSQYDISSTTRN